MTDSSCFLQALRGEKPTHTPIWLMRQAGRYLPEYRAVRANFKDFIAFCLTPDAATEVTVQPVQRFGMDAAIIFADILTIPHALGHAVTFTEGYGPRVAPFAGAGDLDGMRGRLPGLMGVLDPVCQTVRQTRAALVAEKAVIGFSGGPFTLACYMVDAKPSAGIPKLLAMAEQEPATFTALLDVLTAACIDYLDAQIVAGADAVQVFESWALACPPALWDTAVVAPLRAIGAALRVKHPTVPVLGFPRGATPTQLEGFVGQVQGAVTGVSLSTDIDMGWAARVLQPRMAIQGNLDPLLMEGDVAPMVAAARRILDAAGGKPNFVFNLGHGLNPTAKADNVKALVELVQAWR